jgi:RecJ-like exonuclease
MICPACHGHGTRVYRADVRFEQWAADGEDYEQPLPRKCMECQGSGVVDDYKPQSTASIAATSKGWACPPEHDPGLNALKERCDRADEIRAECESKRKEGER